MHYDHYRYNYATIQPSVHQSVNMERVPGLINAHARQDMEASDVEKVE